MLFANRGGAQWLIAFLGNPGPRYAFTRHNAGFLTADEMEKLLNIRIDRLRFRALTATAEIAGEKVLLMKPQTFMNLSGEAVGQAARFYKIPPEHVLVVSDEVSLPVGSIRIRLKGSAGGHNGLKSVISHLGTDAFPRVRLGASVQRPLRSMIWLIGCSAPSGMRTLRPSGLLRSRLQRPASASLRRGRIRP